MDEYSLSSKELRTLRKMRGRDRVPETEIYNCHDLYVRGFIEANVTETRDAFNACVRDGTYKLTEKYWRLSRVRTETWVWRFIPIAISLAALVVSIIALTLQS